MRSGVVATLPFTSTGVKRPGCATLLGNCFSSETTTVIPVDGLGVQQPRELVGHAHAAVRGRVARQAAGVQRDARPREPLHVGHRRGVVDARVVVGVLLQDREHAGRRLVALLARRNRRDADHHAVAVDVGELLRQRHDHHHRSVGRDLRMPDELARLELRRRRVHRDADGGRVLRRGLRRRGSGRQAEQGTAGDGGEGEALGHGARELVDGWRQGREL